MKHPTAAKSFLLFNLILLAALVGLHACGSSNSPTSSNNPPASTATFTFTLTPTPTGTWYTSTPTNSPTATPTSTNTPVHPYVSQWNTDVTAPTGVALDGSGNVYVNSSSGGWITKYDSAGVSLLHFAGPGSGNGQLSNPNFMAVDGSGNIYVADYGNNRVQVFNSAGAYSTKWSLAGPSGIVLYSSYVYTTEYTNNDIVRTTTSGGSPVTYGGPGSTSNTFNGPEGIAIDASGNMYVADSLNYQVKTFNSSFTPLHQWGSVGAGNSQFGTGYGCVDIALDGNGHVYVSDERNNRIEIFTTSGTYLDQWGSVGTGNGLFTNPLGVASTTGGTVYVADGGNNRVQKFGP